MDVVVIPIKCACGRQFEVECEAHPGQTRSGLHEFRCPSCRRSHELPDVLVRAVSKDLTEA